MAADLIHPSWSVVPELFLRLYVKGSVGGFLDELDAVVLFQSALFDAEESFFSCCEVVVGPANHGPLTWSNEPTVRPLVLWYLCGANAHGQF